MQKIRKKLLAALLAGIIVSSAVQVPAWSEAASSDNGTASAGEGEAAASGDEAAAPSEEEMLAEMSVMAENDKLALYVNESAIKERKDAVFAVKNKDNGYVWWSGFVKGSDKVKQNKRSAILAIEALNKETKNVESMVRATSKDNATTKVSAVNNGAEFSFYFNSFSIGIKLRVTINPDGSFTATVPQNGITEDHTETDHLGIGYELVRVHILENMGGTDRSEDGLMIVPDGSGAVIEYNNGALLGDVNTYKSTVYGRDLASGLLTAGPVIERVTMPVMGRITRGGDEDNGLVMIATEGDEFAVARAEVTGQITTKDLNDCWFEFDLRGQDKYYIGSGIDPLSVFEAKGIKTGDVAVTYYPIHGSGLSYIDVANVYRNYLINTVGVKKKTAANDAPFYLTLYGGTVKSRSVMGFPVNIQTPATTYKQALQLIRDLEEGGVNNIKIIYEDFNEAGIVGEIAAAFQYSSKLGGKSDYKKLADYAAEKGYEIFPSCDIMEFGKSGNGYSFTLNSSKQITNSYSTQTPFELAYGLPDELKKSTTVLSPYYFSDIFTKLINSFKAEGATGISLNQASYTLYSDFSRHNADGRDYFTRKDASGILQDGYKRLSESGFKIMGENTNQYLLKYVDYIKDVPLYSSNYDVISYDIPFAQMVLHGLIPYSSRALNKSSNAEELRLLSIVTGSSLHYEMMYEKPNTFSDSEYDTLYYTDYRGCEANAIEYSKQFEEIIAGVSDCFMTDYERLSDTQYRSTFENGTQITVDLEAYTIGVGKNGSISKEYRLGVK